MVRWVSELVVGGLVVGRLMSCKNNRVPKPILEILTLTHGIIFLIMFILLLLLLPGNNLIGEIPVFHGKRSTSLVKNDISIV